MNTIFISFSSKETNEATKVCKFLEENGIPCFISTRDLIPGQEYAQQLLNNIDNSKALVLLLSNASNTSPHVLREVEYAVSHKVPILVYTLEDVVLSKSMEYFLMTHQWINNADNKEQQLLDSINSITTDNINNKELNYGGKSTFTGKKHLSFNKYICLGAILAVCLLAACVFVLQHKKDASGSYSDVDKSGTEAPGNYVVGDTVIFGNYYNEPIEWRVIKINDDGTMVLLSKYILSIKSFDAPEGGKYNEYDGVSYWTSKNQVVADEELLTKIRGNNDWSISNLRTWLNSDAETVNYPDQAPTFNAVGDNFYNSEPGFLYNFTDAEKNALVKVTNRSTANTLSKTPENGYVTSEEYVYLLSSEELEWLNTAGIPIYAKPTEKCIENDAYKKSYEIFVNDFHTQNYYWWLRDNPKEAINEVYIVVTEHEEGNTIVPVTAGVSSYGVRPAVTVDMKSETIAIAK